MAITATHLVTSGDEVDRTTYTTASISPSSNNLVLALVYGALAGGSAAPTLSGNGLTWVQVDTQTFTNRRVTLFRAMGTSPSSGAVTIDFGAATQARCHWSIAEFGNVDTTGTNGSGAIVQSVTDSGTATSLTVTLAAFSGGNNATYGGVTALDGGDITEGSGFSELGEYRNATEPSTTQSEWKNTNDTSVDFSWSGNVEAAGIAVEIKEFTGGAFLMNFI